MFPTISVGPLVFPTAGLLILLGAYASLNVVERSARLLGQDAARLSNLALTALAAGFIGARLAFVVQYWPAFQRDPLGIVWPLNSGFNVWGGLIAAAAAALFYGRFHQLRPLPALDALIPGLLTGLLFISLADFLGGPGFGKLTSLPWGITQFGVRRHPVQLYELFTGGLALLAWWRLRRDRLPDGQRLYLATALYSGGRLFVDAFRENAWLADSGIHLLQVVSLVVMLAAMWLLGQTMSRSADR